jgi:GNAT superfamily N-acetyltransferase
MDLHYQQLSPASVEPVHDILRLCGLDMQERLGLGHWVPPYPLEKLRRDAEHRQVYAVVHKDQIVATFTLGTALPASYERIPAILQMWNTAQPRALYINHLAILPDLQGRGLGRRCMGTIESMAAALGCEVIRLDAYIRHSGLQVFYPKLGYRDVAHVVFLSERRGEAETVCYEKLLAPVADAG